MVTKIQKTTTAGLEKKVRSAAGELEKSGIRITNANIREKIRGGSFRDIGPLVKALLAEKSAREKAETAVPDMPEEIAELATAIWEGAYRATDEAAAADRWARAEEIKALRNELSDRDEEVAIVEEERDALIERAELAEEHAADQAMTIQELKLTIASLEGRLMGRSDTLNVPEAGQRDKRTSEPGNKGNAPSNAKADLQPDMFKVNDESAVADCPAA